MSIPTQSAQHGILAEIMCWLVHHKLIWHLVLSTLEQVHLDKSVIAIELDRCILSVIYH